MNDPYRRQTRMPILMLASPLSIYAADSLVKSEYSYYILEAYEVYLVIRLLSLFYDHNIYYGVGNVINRSITSSGTVLPTCVALVSIADCAESYLHQVLLLTPVQFYIVYYAAWKTLWVNTLSFESIFTVPYIDESRK